MCRMMLISVDRPRSHDARLHRFAAMCRRSPEYQGHGWGAAWWDGEQWRQRRSPHPIWEEPDLSLPASDRLLVHARSAFRDEDIALANNMPFLAGDVVFAFNGELHGVRLRAPGRTGAARVLNLMRRLGPAATVGTSARTRALLEDRTREILGMNWIVAGRGGAVVSTHMGRREDYYTMFGLKYGAETIVCSAPLDDRPGWRPFAAGIREVPW